MGYYLIGIKGSGMSALAVLLREKGEKVKGCDILEYCFTEGLFGDIEVDDIKDFKINDQIVICSSAYPELYEKYKTTNECYYYHEFVGKIHKIINIAICGTHGKTTVTSLLKHVLKNVTYLIGDGHGGYSDGDIFLFEACEYKRHFLSYNPTILVITNIEKDHLDYYKNEEDIISAFQELSNRSMLVFANGDDENCQKLKGNIIYFGYNDNNNIQIKRRGKSIYLPYYDEEYEFPFFGDYMVYNMVSSIIVAKELKCKKINFNDFVFPKRRREIYKINDGIVIDDYAHHPTEIRVTLQSIKEEFDNKKITVFFQPHTYNRLCNLWGDFIEVFKEIDNLYIEEIFSSPREKNLYSIDSLLNELPNAKKMPINIKKPDSDDVYVFFSAGDLYKKIEQLK